MATTGSQVFARARRILQDEGASPYWTDAELIDWINDGQDEIVAFKPDASAGFVNVSLVAGTKQSIAGLMLLDVTRNMGTGSTPGLAPEKIGFDVINSFLPTWHQQTAAAQVDFWMYDVRIPGTFWVSPPQPSATTQVLETIQSVRPTKLTLATGSVSIDDRYVSDLVNYVLFRAYAKASDVQGSTAKSNGYFQLFLNGLGVKDNAAKVLNIPKGGALPQTQAGGGKA